MQHPKLKLEKREMLGKKVKKLRKAGMLPGNVYGKNMDSTAVQIAEKEFITLYKEVGETGLIDLQIDGATRPVLITDVQRNPLTRLYLHADFFQVNLKEKIKTTIPVITTGEPQAVLDKVGLLLQTLSEVEIEALPDNLPENIEINVEHLAQLDEHVTVADLKAPEGVTILTEPEQVVAKISELVSKEAEEQAQAEAAASEAAKAEGAEGAEPAIAEDETPAETPKEETKAE